LADCVQAYLPLTAPEKQALDQMTQTESYAEVRAMNQTVYEKGIEKGRREGQVDLTEALLAERFSPVSAAMREHLQQRSEEDLRHLVLKIAAGASLAELG
jgi:flagellar biosynthesis/type III secretory pathway protein FliH